MGTGGVWYGGVCTKHYIGQAWLAFGGLQEVRIPVTYQRRFVQSFLSIACYRWQMFLGFADWSLGSTLQRRLSKRAVSPCKVECTEERVYHELSAGKPNIVKLASICWKSFSWSVWSSVYRNLGRHYVTKKGFRLTYIRCIRCIRYIRYIRYVRNKQNAK